MSSSLSPEHSLASGSQHSPGDVSGVSPLLQVVADKRTTRDGQPPKRRGPKPDAKPALTRRQELNRQAQRTHRERKEQYVKALEDEVMRMKESYAKVARDKEALIEENKQLREALMLNGIAFPTQQGVATTFGGSGIGSDDLSTPPQGTFSPSPSQFSQSSAHTQPHQLSPSGPAGGLVVDSEQAGIDFVLTLERPCMNHMPLVSTALADPKGYICGHALMASCPPAGNSAESSFGGEPVDPVSGQQTWKLSKSELSTLLDLSERLDLKGELTPVMAWKMIISDPRVTEFDSEDFEQLLQSLQTRVRCYGFGAVMEEWEVRDAMASISGQRAGLMAH